MLGMPRGTMVDLGGGLAVRGGAARAGVTTMGILENPVHNTPEAVFFFLFLVSCSPALSFFLSTFVGAHCFRRRPQKQNKKSREKEPRVSARTIFVQDLCDDDDDGNRTDDMQSQRKQQKDSKKATRTKENI